MKKHLFIACLGVGVAACVDDVLLGGELPRQGTPPIEAGVDGKTVDADPDVVVTSDGSVDVDAGSKLPSGILDPSFATKGYVTRLTDGDIARGVAVDGSGRVLVATSGVDGQAMVLRLLPNGTFDNAFGNAGAWTAFELDGGSGSTGLGIVTDGTGNAKLTGALQTTDGTNFVAVWGITASGTNDTSFGTGGVAARSSPGSTYDLTSAIARAGSDLVVAGYSTFPPDGGGGYSEWMSAWRFAPSGAKATTFGGDGYVRASGTAGRSPGYDTAYAVAAAPDGSVVVAGQTLDASEKKLAGIWRFTSAGAVDGTFGTNGHVLLSGIAGNTSATSYDFCKAVVIDAQGRIVFGGWTSDADGRTQGFVGRLTSSGAIDATFGSAGFTVMPVSANGSYAEVNALAIDSQGRIVGGGGVRDTTPANVAAWRLTSAGMIDTTFGTNGRFMMSGTAEGIPTAQGDGAYGIAVDPQDRPVLSGYSSGVNDGSQPPGRPIYLAIWRLTP